MKNDPNFEARDQVWAEQTTANWSRFGGFAIALFTASETSLLPAVAAGFIGYKVIRVGLEKLMSGDDFADHL